MTICSENRGVKPHRPPARFPGWRVFCENGPASEAPSKTKRDLPSNLGVFQNEKRFSFFRTKNLPNLPPSLSPKVHMELMPKHRAPLLSSLSCVHESSGMPLKPPELPFLGVLALVFGVGVPKALTSGFSKQPFLMRFVVVDLELASCDLRFGERHYLADLPASLAYEPFGLALPLMRHPDPVDPAEGVIAHILPLFPMHSPDRKRIDGRTFRVP